MKPTPDPVEANSDDVTMALEDDHVHIPVLENDVTKDTSDICLAVQTDKPSVGKVTFQVSSCFINHFLMSRLPLSNAFEKCSKEKKRCEKVHLFFSITSPASCCHFPPPCLNF